MAAVLSAGPSPLPSPPGGGFPWLHTVPAPLGGVVMLTGLQAAGTLRRTRGTWSQSLRSPHHSPSVPAPRVPPSDTAPFPLKFKVPVNGRPPEPSPHSSRVLRSPPRDIAGRTHAFTGPASAGCASKGQILTASESGCKSRLQGQVCPQTPESSHCPRGHRAPRPAGHTWAGTGPCTCRGARPGEGPNGEARLRAEEASALGHQETLTSA